MAILADADKTTTMSPPPDRAPDKPKGRFARWLARLRPSASLAPESLCRTSALVALRAASVRDVQGRG
jgi:hypothetical protein